MFSCSRCTYPLVALKHDGIGLLHCRRCGGSFLEPGDIHGTYGRYVDPEVWKSLPTTQSLGVSSLPCPHGHGALEAFLVQWDGESVEVDLCGTCGGLWLDADEGMKLHRIAKTASRELDPILFAPEQEFEVDEGEKELGVGSYLFQLLTGFPIEVWNPVKKRALVVLGLVLILFVAYACELFFTQNLQENLVGTFLRKVGVIPVEILQGEGFYKLFTHMFFHLGWIHLLGNLYFLYIFGDNVEDTLGWVRFSLLYLLSGLGAVGLHVLFHQTNTLPMIGASGAISGLMGAYLVLFPRVQVWVVMFFVRFKVNVGWYFLFWVGIQLVMFHRGVQGTAWLAHLGGFGMGLLLAFLMRNQVPTEEYQIV